ncbi:MAG: alpha-1,4-glucan--maltose-1-phosphate maltosyltransferase [Isosphaeraceae bacterium]
MNPAILAETGASAGRSPSRPVHPPSKAPSRVIVEAVSPEIDGGRFPIKRTVGESVRVEADVFADGHDVVRAVVKSRPASGSTWSESPMTLIGPGTDRYSGMFVVEVQGRHEYTVEAWIDRFASWHHEVTRKHEAGQELSSELLEGAALIREAASRATKEDAAWLLERAELVAGPSPMVARVASGLDRDLSTRMARYPDRSQGSTYDRSLPIIVERERARFSSWYEMFPRSAAKAPGLHGTFSDVERLLPYVAGMGFDVLYLPPIHPIGVSHRKGPNNGLVASVGDPGSPWAIGGIEGGHTSVHPDLGTLDDFDRLVASAARHGLEIALDIAFQASPDHPWVREHPEWFRHRPDGSIKYAENPPKKYQDIYPIDFECDAWESLYEALRDVFLFWSRRGVHIFRVDNPHTKPFRFWDWVIREVWDRDPDAIFLSEAFTRPKLMKRLAKGGFTQSYSYFTWRNTKTALTDYFQELGRSESADYMRPNLFANTPDILNEYLQDCGRPGFMIRLVLAATLAGNYGIYGPPFELCDGTPVRRGSEEYLDSEKYQVRFWERDQPHSLADFIARINAIRKGNRALQSDRNVRFVPVENDQIIAYLRTDEESGNQLLVVVSLDPHYSQSGWVHLPDAELGLDDSYQVHDLIGDGRFLWRRGGNFVRLEPHSCPAHIFRIRRRLRTERDFDYYA